MAPVLVVAHRGDPVGHIENTLPSFQSAVRLGADMIELDCRMSRDGQVVVLHDPTMQRLWGVRRALAEMDWSEVRLVRRKHYQAPLLSEVLDAVDVPVMVDVGSVGAALAALDIVQSAGAVQRCIFAGATNALVRLRHTSPGVRVALTWERRSRPGPELLDVLRPDWFNPYWRRAHPSLVQWAHSAGMAVSVWTVDHPWAMRRMLRAGVDAIITNRTERLVMMAER